MVADPPAEVERLRMEIGSLKRELATESARSRALAGASEEASSLRASLREVERGLEDERLRRQRAERERDEALSAAKRAQQAEDRLQEECASLQQRRMELTRQVRQLEARIEELEDDARAHRGAAGPARADGAAGGLADRAGEVDEEMLRIVQEERRRNASLEQRIESLTERAGRVERLEEELRAALGRVRELESSGAGGQGNGPSAAEEFAYAGASDADGDVVEVEASVLRELRASLGRMKKSRDKLLARVEAQMREMEQLEEENEGLRAQAEASGAAAGHEAPGEASQLRSEKRRLEAEGAAIRERLMAFERASASGGAAREERLVSENAELSARAAELEGRVAELEGRLRGVASGGVTAAEVRGLREEVEVLRGQVRDARAALAAAEAEVARLRDAAKDLAASRDQSEAAAMELTAEVAFLRDENRRLAAQGGRGGPDGAGVAERTVREAAARAEQAERQRDALRDELAVRLRDMRGRLVRKVEALGQNGVGTGGSTRHMGRWRPPVPAPPPRALSGH